MDQVNTDTAEIALKVELAELARIAPKDRTPTQNERLQAIEIERQKLLKPASKKTAK